MWFFQFLQTIGGEQSERKKGGRRLRRKIHPGRDPGKGPII